MALFPFNGEKNFETGNETGTAYTEFDGTQVDTDGIMDVAHYSTLAGMADRSAAPYSGAYCARFQLNGGTGVSYFLNEGTPLDMSLDDSVVIRFRVYLGTDLTATAEDDMNILSFIQAGTDTMELGIRMSATGDPSFYVNGNGIVVESTTRAKGQWYSLEGVYEVDAGVGNDGSINLFVTPENGYSNTTAVATDTALNSAATTSVRQGIVSAPLATTTGLILMDDLRMDIGTANISRFHANPTRWNRKFEMTAPGHAFVGPGTIDNISIIAGTATTDIGTTLVLYDTDTARNDDHDNIVAMIKASGAPETYDPAGLPLKFTRGCYVDFQDAAGNEANMGSAGDENPRANIQLGHVSAWGSPGAVRAYGARRTFSG